jgi:hypothetical protein
VKEQGTVRRAPAVVCGSKNNFRGFRAPAGFKSFFGVINSLKSKNVIPYKTVPSDIANEIKLSAVTHDLPHHVHCFPKLDH